MIVFAELRAKAWKYGAIAGAVLAVAACFAAVLFRADAAASGARADAQSARADALAAQVESLQQAQYRDDVASDATTTARDAAEDRAVDHNARAARVEAIANEPRPPVPAGCPEPDARLLRESADQAARVRAAEDRLRNLGRPAPGRAR